MGNRFLTKEILSQVNLITDTFGDMTISDVLTAGRLFKKYDGYPNNLSEKQLSYAQGEGFFATPNKTSTPSEDEYLADTCRELHRLEIVDLDRLHGTILTGYFGIDSIDVLAISPSVRVRKDQITPLGTAFYSGMEVQEVYSGIYGREKKNLPHIRAHLDNLVAVFDEFGDTQEATPEFEKELASEMVPMLVSRAAYALIGEKDGYLGQKRVSNAYKPMLSAKKLMETYSIDAPLIYDSIKEIVNLTNYKDDKKL